MTVEELHELHCDANGCGSLLRFRNEFFRNIRKRAAAEGGWTCDESNSPLYVLDYCPTHAAEGEGTEG